MNTSVFFYLFDNLSTCKRKYLGSGKTFLHVQVTAYLRSIEY
jgi:hypothetical protein